MARDSIHVAATPDAVFAVLADPYRYADWVVGTREVAAADAGWPEPGTALRYVAGVGPLQIRDRTVVLQSHPPHRLELLAEAGPLPAARIALDLQPERGGTRVTLDERPAQPLVHLALWPVGHFWLSRRNAWSLRRLKRLAETREQR